MDISDRRGGSARARVSLFRPLSLSLSHTLDRLSAAWVAYLRMAPHGGGPYRVRGEARARELPGVRRSRLASSRSPWRWRGGECFNAGVAGSSGAERRRSASGSSRSDRFRVGRRRVGFRVVRTSASDVLHRYVQPRSAVPWAQSSRRIPYIHTYIRVHRYLSSTTYGRRNVPSLKRASPLGGIYDDIHPLHGSTSPLIESNRPRTESHGDIRADRERDSTTRTRGIAAPGPRRAAWPPLSEQAACTRCSEAW